MRELLPIRNRLEQLQIPILSRALRCWMKNGTADGVPKAWAYYRLAQIHRHKGEKSEALNYIDKAISALPKIKAFQKEKSNILEI